MKILVLETSTLQSSVAVLNEDRISQRSIAESLRQAVALQAIIAEILQEEKLQLKDLDAVAYSAGPGSFTGLRVGAAFAQGLAFAANLKLIQIPSLQIWAQTAFENLQCQKTLVAVDAKMQQVYWGVYQLGEEGIMQAFDVDQLLRPEQIVAPDESGWVAIGDAWDIFNLLQQEALSFIVKEKVASIYPQAGVAGQLAKYYFSQGKFTLLDMASPVYLRGQEAWKKINN